ncbi:hypothetical protein [Lacticaseibacillus sharpeae]|nr:hypothetical protein [Lacticaseibacillus sharpeae]
MPQYRYFAQPIANIKTKHIIVYELLLRQWVPDKDAWLRPDTFDLTPDA